MHTLHLLNYKFEHRFTAVKGVRAALEQFGVPLDKSLSKARDIVNALRDSDGDPQLVGSSEDEAVIERAVNLLDEHGCRSIVDLDSAYEPDEDEVNDVPATLQRQHVEPDFSVAQAQTAMACLAFAKGDPSLALAFCRTLSHTTDEDDFFAGVENALLSTFPPPQRDTQIPVVVMR